MKNEFITQPYNYCQIPIFIPACIMSSEYFTITYIYLIKLLIFEWLKMIALKAFTSKLFEETELVAIS